MRTIRICCLLVCIVLLGAGQTVWAQKAVSYPGLGRIEVPDGVEVNWREHDGVKHILLTKRDGMIEHGERMMFGAVQNAALKEFEKNPNLIYSGFMANGLQLERIEPLKKEILVGKECLYGSGELRGKNAREAIHLNFYMFKRQNGVQIIYFISRPEARYFWQPIEDAIAGSWKEDSTNALPSMNEKMPSLGNMTEERYVSSVDKCSDAIYKGWPEELFAIYYIKQFDRVAPTGGADWLFGGGKAFYGPSISEFAAAAEAKGWKIERQVDKPMRGSIYLGYDAEKNRVKLYSVQEVGADGFTGSYVRDGHIYQEWISFAHVKEDAYQFQGYICPLRK